MQHARLKASEQPAWGSEPLLQIGHKPSAVNGRFHQLENVINVSSVFSLPAVS
jgi:hypothetical protein